MSYGDIRRSYRERVHSRGAPLFESDIWTTHAR